MVSNDRVERRRGMAFLTGGRVGVRLVSGVACAVLLALAVTGVLPFGYAVGAMAVVVAAAFLAPDGNAAGNPASSAVERAPLTDASLLDGVIAGLPDGVVVLDREARVVAFNAPAHAIAPALARGQPIALAVRVPEIIEAVRGVGSSNAPQRVEFSQRVPVDRWFVVHVTPLGPAGAAASSNGLMMLVFQDLTPLRRVEEMRADFVANASHELRTPLAALSGFIDTLLGPAREDTPAREKFLGIMKTQATRMARLIDDLLSLSRVELNEHLHPQAPTDLVSIIRQVADGLQMLARERGVEIAIAAPAAPVIVPGDRDELTRVFENLVENALKYGAPGKKVDISFAAADAADGSPEAVIKVRDYGPGIAAEHLPRLTERFYRVDVTQSRAEGGTGLGLSLVKHTLNRHRGKLAIESVVGQGATFTARLPLIPRDE